MKRIAIIGGGISGLTAAFALEQARGDGASFEYELFESSSRLGGVLRSELVDGCLVEAGPDSFLTEKPWAADLCRELGIGDQLIGSNDFIRKTYILVNGCLVAMPDGLMFIVPTKILPVLASPLFSFSTKLRMAREWFHPIRKSEEDESVAALVERHYGKEMVDRLVDPLLCGVYGGDASRLSLRAVMPRFAEMEANSGSLGRAMLGARRKAATVAPRSLFTTLKGGMQQIVDAVVQRLTPASVHCGVAVNAINPEGEGWVMSAGERKLPFDALIVAIPAQAASAMLRETIPELSSELQGIEYSSSVTVALGYSREVCSALPPGFGFLVPRSEGRRVLATTFVHNKFNHRAPADRALIRCFLGGIHDYAVLSLPEDEIVAIVRHELGQILGIKAEPLFARVYKWRAAMAQYDVGHLERLQRIERLRQQFPTLALAGNAYRGIGVPDCIRSGKTAAEQALGAVGLASSTVTV
jgi:oxygen-dependent protoporphyrinogen oxidase